MPRTLYVSLLVLSGFLPNAINAQNVQWLTVAPSHWSLNPSLLVDVLCARDPEHVYVAGLDTASYLYGNAVLGGNTLSRLGSDGSTIWSTTLGDSVMVETIASDADGNTVLGGRYFGRLRIDGDAVLQLATDHTSPGTFLCAWDANGQLLWQRDVSGGPIDDVSVASLAVDPQGRMWAALSTFFGAEVVRLAADGATAESRPLADSKHVGSISFDPSGGMYVSGAASVPGIGINGTTYPVTEQYNFYVARMNAAGDAQWLQLATDVTFQRPRVVADGFDHAYLLGSQMDSVIWDGILFHRPEWNSSFFLARLDSTGSFEWGVEPPQAGLQGQFELAQGMSLGVDANGNAYVYGITNGVVDWGNGVVSTAGTLTDRKVTVLSFDAAGIARWERSGGSATLDVTHDLAVTDDGICHLVASTGGPFTFGPFTVDPTAVRGSVVARIDDAAITGIADGADESGTLIACPSLFTNTFHLVSNALPEGGAIEVMMIDATGRSVQQTTRLGDELGAGLAPGSYAVRVRIGERSLFTRVVKEE